ncbi:TPA: hypothetical protein RMT51_004842 [Escherichia coli]|nr:hypothetical protein [Escherichia coli]
MPVTTGNPRDNATVFNATYWPAVSPGNPKTPFPPALSASAYHQPGLLQQIHQLQTYFLNRGTGSRMAKLVRLTATGTSMLFPQPA